MKTTDKNRNYEGDDLEVMANAKNYYSWLIKEFGKYIGKDVAEVGAGNGNFSEFILKTRLESFTAIEPSVEMYPLLKDRFANTPNVLTYNDYLDNISSKFANKFDTMFYINVLEHVQYDEMQLGIANTCLKKGGHVCIYVPALTWLYSDFDKRIGHYRRYTKKNLQQKLIKHGFEVQEIHYSDFPGVFPWLLMFKILKRKNLKVEQLMLYDKLIIPILRISESIVRPPIGKNIFAVAKKI